MAKNIICTEDCSPFRTESCTNNSDWQKPLQDFSNHFLSDQSVFHFLSNKKNKDDDMPFAQWLRDVNSNTWKWFAGRWVGSAKTDKYTIRVSPRFGNLSLFVLLDEIFSINILNNLSEEDVSNTDSLLQKLIPFIWVQKLGEANKYGIPHTTIDVLHKGPNVKGRLMIRKSILPFFKQKEVVSATREKQVDATICRIILQAYQLLNKNKAMNIRSRLSENAENALINFENAKIPDTHVTPKQYRDIRYKSIYESWRGIVDFSWQIIQNHNFAQKKSENTKGFGMFVDMAEIWEMFLRSKLRKAFPEWDISSPEIEIYDGTFFKGEIIPDIVMKKGNDVMVFDAKWKRMKFNQYDVDRADLYQIHTYIQYYQQKGFNVIAGGLLYPISAEKESLVDNRHSNLFGNRNESTVFLVDGICFGKEKNADGNKLDKDKIEIWKNLFSSDTEAFLDRIKRYV
jgi:5-methylcytosine-specific restriction endonuclease McrBC regulatory subunit McrC